MNLLADEGVERQIVESVVAPGTVRIRKQSS